MEDEILALRWNNHCTSFIKTLSNLYRKELFNDVTVFCDGHFFHAHRFVLSVCSEYFYEVFQKVSCKHPIVILKDISYTNFECLLNYMYFGEANIVKKELTNLMAAADSLKVKGLAMYDFPVIKDGKRTLTDLGCRNDSFDFKKRKSEQCVRKQSKSCVDIGKCRNTSKYLQSRNDGMPQNLIKSRNSPEGPPPPNLPEVVLEESGDSVDVNDSNSVTKNECGANLSAKSEDEDVPTLSSSISLVYDNLHLTEIKDSATLSSEAHTVMQEILAHSILPGPSGMQNECLHGWDNLGESQSSFSIDRFTAEKPVSSESPHSDSQGSSSGCSHAYHCPFCSRAFMYRSDLSRHVRSHTGEKPFECHLCSYKATQKTHLHEHVKRKHRID